VHSCCIASWQIAFRNVKTRKLPEGFCLFCVCVVLLFRLESEGRVKGRRVRVHAGQPAVVDIKNNPVAAW
jgi:hypothetical protein